MTIEEVPVVVVDQEGGHKYIVVLLSDDNEEKIIVRADKRHEWHRDILFELQREVRQFGLRAQCLGGGYIRVSSEQKAIRIWDYSSDFGREPNRELTAAMLRGAFPDFKIEVRR